MLLFPQMKSCVELFTDFHHFSIIALHGLGAHPDYAWVDRTTAKPVHWLKDEDMLPRVVPNSRILRYGYNAKWFGEDSVKSRIKDMAQSFLYSLDNDPERQVFELQTVKGVFQS
jgi:hypothetical protein